MRSGESRIRRVNMTFGADLDDMQGGLRVGFARDPGQTSTG